MRIAPKGARRGEAEVLIRCADDASITVAGVELPQPESVTTKYTRLIGFGLLFAIFLVVRAVRRRTVRTDPGEGGGGVQS